MFERPLTVKYIVTSKTCFCYLSEKCYRLLEQGRVIEVLHGDDKFYFSCAQPMNLPDNELGINSTFARNLGLREGDSVHVRAVFNFAGIKSLTITTKSKDDYDIMGMLAQNIQATLLDQIRIVNKCQKIVIWISSSLYVVATVDGAHPFCPGRLDYLTEVLVLPPILNPEPAISTKLKENTPPPAALNKFLNYFQRQKGKSETTIHCKPMIAWRINKFNELECLKNSKLKQPFHVFAFREALPVELRKNNSKDAFLLMLLDYIKPPDQSNPLIEEQYNVKSLYVRLAIIEDFVENTNGFLVQKHNLYCSHEVFSYFGAKVGAKVTLEFVERKTNIGSEVIEIHCSKLQQKHCIDKFKNYVNEHVSSGLIYLMINTDVPVRIENSFGTYLFKIEGKSYCLVDSDTIRSCKIKPVENVINFLAKDDSFINKMYYTDFGNYSRIIDGCLELLKKGYKNGNLENVLVTGKAGTGKTTLTTILTDILKVPPYNVHIERLHCKSLKGKSVDSLTKVLSATFQNLIYYQPSLLIIDDLSVICEKVLESDAPTQETLLFNRISEILAEFLSIYTANNYIAVIATCESVVKLNTLIFSSRGRHLFKNIYNIDDLNKNDRKLIIKHLFASKNVTNVDLDFVAVETEGYVLQDIVDFIDKAIFEAYKERCTLTTSHCERALKKCSSLSLRDVQLHAPGERDFSDIGGLETVKKILVETLLWPTRYSNLFGAAPLRLQSGMLLYGPPGTGKTLLAGAAAKHCGLRLISVKGPELLSKYIGASEQSVRDVFQKAQSARPCILFFDEFDSLAPRRGHDSTGVTDRVVNQFLTQLDGVESLTGVCVLAATSRPDLLDPALLRPGRLDKQVLCPLPDSKERLSILKALSRKMTLGKLVSLEKVAKSTEGYSGADLQAVLYTAQLTSVEKILDRNKGAIEPEQVQIEQSDIEEALKHTRPSLSKDEKAKYQRIYARFQGKTDLQDLKNMKQRATLA